MARARGGRARRWPWVVGVVLAVMLVPIALIAVPILMHEDSGLSGQGAVADFPLEVSGTGDDGRTRELMILPVEAGGSVDTAALAEGDRLVVSGSGFDASRGIYVAICVIPDDAGTKPGPCLGGIPSQEQDSSVEGAVQFAPSNWINDDWAWRLFGARAYDDVETGTFTAYLEVPAPVGEGIDCREQECGIFSRNDHTAASDRVQDLYVPVAFTVD